MMTAPVPPLPPSFPADRRDAALESIVAQFAPIADFSHEVAIFAYLDPNWRLLGMRRVSSGLADSLVIHLRDVVADALFFDAAAVAMAHNHPSGDPTPSHADYAVTRRLARTLDTIGVQLIEHLIFARDGRESFREAGLL